VAKTRVSSKGQVVIPSGVRVGHGWTAGTILEIEDRGDCIVLRPLPRLARTTLAELAGCTGYRGPAKSIEEMDAAIAKAARRSR
jgi:AbrB family looped-hinge helix DNA binding protein